MTGRLPSSPPVLLVAVLLLLSGCTVFASKSDYADYRQIRIADNDHDRARAMSRYVRAHPEGRWSSEMREKLEGAEDAIYEDGKATIDGLQFYVDVFPEGTYVQQAEARLKALRAVDQRRRGEAQAHRDVRREQRESQLEARRQWATKATTFWVQTLLGIDNWGSPIPEVARANPEFSRAFGKNPRPRCSQAECIKFYRLPYSIPVPGATRIDRDLDLLLRLRLSEGKLVRAEVLMPNKGFSRWYELENRTLVTDEDPAQRNEAIELALSRIVPAIKAAVPTARHLDIISELIDPPAIRAPNEPDEGAAVLPDEEEPPPEQEAPAAAEPAGEAAPGQGGVIGELMDRAVGAQEGPGAGGRPPEAAPAEEEPETLVLPIAIQGFQAGRLQLGIFAAPAEDYGRAYDGLFIERIPSE